MELERIAGEGSRPQSRKGNSGDAYHGQLVARRSVNLSRRELAEPTSWMQDEAAEIALHVVLVGRSWVTTADADVLGTSRRLAESDVDSRTFHAALTARPRVTALEPTDAEPMGWIADHSGVSPPYHGRLTLRSRSMPDDDEPGGAVIIEGDGALCRSFHGGLLARSAVTTDDSGVPSFSTGAEANGGGSMAFHGGLMFRSTDSEDEDFESDRMAYSGNERALMRSFHGGLLSRSTLEKSRPSVWVRMGRMLRQLASSLVPADDRPLPAPDQVAFSRALPRPAMRALPAPVGIRSAPVGRPEGDSVAGGGLFPVG